MATEPTQDQINIPLHEDLSVIGPDATAAFEPAGRPADPTEHASSENLIAAPRTPALDEEDETEDDDPDEDDDDLDEDDDLEDEEDEDDDLEDEDDDLEDDDDEDDLDDEDEDEEEDEDEDDDEVAAKKKK